MEFLREIPEEDRLFLKDDVTDHRVIEGGCESLDYDRILHLLAEANERTVAAETFAAQ